MTDQEFRQQLSDKMGQEFGTVFNSIRNDLIWLTFKLSEYEVLFLKESRVQLFNDAAPFFAYIIQKTLWENTILSVARLIDPKESGKKKTVSLRAIPEFILNDNYKINIENQLNLIIEAGNLLKI